MLNVEQLIEHFVKAGKVTLMTQDGLEMDFIVVQGEDRTPPKIDEYEPLKRFKLELISSGAPRRWPL